MAETQGTITIHRDGSMHFTGVTFDHDGEHVVTVPGAFSTRTAYPVTVIDEREQDAGGGPVRLSVNLARSTADALRRLATRDAISLTEAIRRAIALYKLVSDAMALGESVVIRSAEGKTYREVTFQ